MLAHKPEEECRLEKRFCHICLGHPEGSSVCKPRIAVQFLEKELEKWYPGPGYPPDEWMYMTMPRSNGRLSWGSAEGVVAGLHRGQPIRGGAARVEAGVVNRSIFLFFIRQQLE